jgi:hypothetical protein
MTCSTQGKMRIAGLEDLRVYVEIVFKRTIKKVRECGLEWERRGM